MQGPLFVQFLGICKKILVSTLSCLCGIKQQKRPFRVKVNVTKILVSCTPITVLYYVFFLRAPFLLSFSRYLVPTTLADPFRLSHVRHKDLGDRDKTPESPCSLCHSSSSTQRHASFTCGKAHLQTLCIPYICSMSTFVLSVSNVQNHPERCFRN